MKNSARGFSLVELLMVISLVGILAAASISYFNNSLDEAKWDATYKEMLQLRKALIGDLENSTVEGERIRFGYLGDLGGIPTNAQGLAAVYSKPTAVSSWAINTTANLGMGWNGPYIVSPTTTDYGKDGWGRAYIYRADTTVPYILSYGSDGLVGGTGTAADIQVDLPIDLRTATVTGQVTVSGSVYEGPAYVELYYPSATGAITSMNATLTSADMGQFTFSNVPFGLRTFRVWAPASTNPLLTLGPVMFAVDHQNYFLPSNLGEINPLFGDSNCNTINNVTANGSGTKDSSTGKVKFQLDIDSSFSIRSFYLFANSGNPRIEKITINGIGYGCYGILDHVLGNPINRTIQGCNGVSGQIDLDLNTNLELNSAWGIAAGNDIDVVVHFKSSINTLSRIDIRLGCDLLEIPII